MHEHNYRWLRNVIANANPTEFDYATMFDTRIPTRGLAPQCGCVVWHAVRAGAFTVQANDGIVATRQLADYLGVDFDEAARLYEARSLHDSLSYTTGEFSGKRGIRRAVQCLDEIAQSYGLTPTDSDSQVRERCGAEGSVTAKDVASGDPLGPTGSVGAGVESGQAFTTVCRRACVSRDAQSRVPN